MVAEKFISKMHLIINLENSQPICLECMQKGPREWDKFVYSILISTASAEGINVPKQKDRMR